MLDLGCCFFLGIQAPWIPKKINWDLTFFFSFQRNLFFFSVYTYWVQSESLIKDAGVYATGKTRGFIELSSRIHSESIWSDPGHVNSGVQVFYQELQFRFSSLLCTNFTYPMSVTHASSSLYTMIEYIPQSWL